MHEPISAVRLQALADARRAATRRASHYFAAAPAAGLLALLDVVRLPAAATAALAALAAALWGFARSRGFEARRRELVDDLILRGWRDVAPSDVADRERELVSARHRRMLARALRNQLDYALDGVGFAFGGRMVGVELRQLQRHVDALSTRLRDMSRPVEPRGVVVVTRLLTDAGSPLVRGRTDGLEPALLSAGLALDGTPAPPR